VDAAVAEAARIGFPVYIKTSFSWAGLGATFCGSSTDVANAAEAALRPNSWSPMRSAIRALLNREWYPTNAPVDVQKAIVGVPAMYNCIALCGRSLAGFAGMRHRSGSASGPSSVVWLGAHPRIADASNEMIAALGASGFINFDYMIEEDTDEIYLLECNPRPGQVSHLGPRVDVDLCAALARELRGEAPNESAPENGGEVIHLFPQEWIREPRAVVGLGKNLDVPLDDPKLLNFMIAAGGAVPISDRATSENRGYPWDLQACDVTR
jgi:carbamoylphosphate synthase large subunit